MKAFLLLASGLGALFDFSVEAFHLWNSNLSSVALLGGLGLLILLAIVVDRVREIYADKQKDKPREK